MKIPKIIISLGIVIIVLAGIWVVRRPGPDSNTPAPVPSPTPQILQTTTVIDYGNGQKSTHVRQYTASQSAFLLLKDVASSQNLDIRVIEYSFGTLVEAVGDFPNTRDKSWIYFVNFRSPEVGADQYTVQPGDIIEWKYIKPE